MTPCGGPDPAQVTLVILAGGEGRRMGGLDKGLVPFRGRPLIEHVIERVGSQTAGIVVSANRNQDIYRAYGYPVVGDLRTGFCGPLAGIEAALAVVVTPWALIVPCDVPALPADLLARLAATCNATTTSSVASSGGRRHAVALFPVGAKVVVKRLLEEGERRMQALFKVLDAAEVNFDDCPTAFANLNTADALTAGE